MRQRSRLAIMAVVLLLCTGGLVSAAAYSYRTDQPRDLTYAPQDGAFSQIRLDGHDGQLEQGIQTGDGFLTAGLVGAVAEQHKPKNFVVTHGLWVADARADGDQLRVFFQIGEHDVSLLAVITGTDGLVFSPALPVSHGRESGRRDDRASGTMIVGPGEAEFTATTQVTGHGDCINWSAKITSRTPSADSTISFDSCATTGLQQLSYQRVNKPLVQLTTLSRNPARGRFSGQLRAAPVSPKDLDGWKPGKVGFTVADGTGVSPIYLEADIAPVVLADRRFAVAGTDHSLIVFGDQRKTARVAWMAHPGGRISRLVGAGQLLIACTDQKQVIAYDSQGRRVWQYRTDDLVADAAVSGSRLIMAVYGTGILALDLDTGRLLWHRSDNSVTTGLLQADPDMVVYGDTDHTTHVLAARSGRQLGSSTGDSLGGVGLSQGQPFSLRNHFLYGRDLDGKPYVLDVDAGVVQQLHVAGQLGLVTGSSGVALIDLGSGKQVGTAPAAIGAVDGPGAILVVDNQQTTVYTAAGPSRASWRVKPDSDTSAQDLGLGSWGAVILHEDSAVVIT